MAQVTGVTYDAAVIGGGVLGCATALHLARGGMRVVLVERGALCAQASGVNAGTLSMLHFRRLELVSYALRAWEMWKTAPEWLGGGMEFGAQGGLVLAFNGREAELLEAKTAELKAAGSPVGVVDTARARQIEPGLGPGVVLASHCPMDGHANASLSGRVFRAALVAAGVDLREGQEVTALDPGSGGFEVRATGGIAVARRVVLAGGVWLGRMAAWFGLNAPVSCRVQQMAVTERMALVMGTILGNVNGRLSLKQVDNGTVLIGGGWIGKGDPDRGGNEVISASLVGNIRLARYAIPALARARVVRVWLGLRDVYPDDRPIIGPLPGIDDAYIIGCGISGFTIGPYLGKLLAQRILGQEPEMALFDPARVVTAR
ncbi:MAG: FAD-dependent oxidoreductase [Rhodospirillales bacterium]|jgi:glycine/D-amino acid oxidase-like deaminating enzyme|nr:FAD-dependent oxidoreductase [Rhodospirillales bacterium]MDP6883972.1 FAD-dependent oxidoreductase [Rhodospirillales bacterium]